LPTRPAQSQTSRAIVRQSFYVDSDCRSPKRLKPYGFDVFLRRGLKAAPFQGSAMAGFPILRVELCSTGQPRAAVPTLNLLLSKKNTAGGQRLSPQATLEAL
jgi:hypothetical protein